jgi:crotonobetainyl-CoA:carnitine CoA-transferase CaiB-like acyl-CoA transferase
MLDLRAAIWLNGGEPARQAGNNHPTSMPTGVYQASDGAINIGGSGGAIFERFCRAVGLPELGQQAEFASEELRSRNRDRLNELIEPCIRRKTRAEWVEEFNAAGVPAGPIYSVEEVFADPQVQHLGVVGAVEHPQLGPLHLLKPGFAMSGWSTVLRNAAPARGQHTAEVLSDLGHCEADIKKLRCEGVI